MNIEIRKAGFENKGAQLMIHAIVEAMSGKVENPRFVMIPNNKSAPYEIRARYGFHQKASFYSHRIQWGKIASLIPERFRSAYGIVLDKELDMVFDAAGFAYGDQWGSSSIRELAQSIRRWKKNGTKVVLLPQAFGPFKNKSTHAPIREVVKNADLIFTRDPLSYEFLTGVAGETGNIFIAPDFTNLVAGKVPSGYDINLYRFCIVPNYRMVDRTVAEISERYVPFLTDSVQYLKDKGANPFFLIHEGDKDRMVAEQISRTVGNIPVISEDDPILLKGIIGQCDGMIGSRYHSLISGLSQGVPALATGWSHKYKMLFEEYDFAEGLLDLKQSKKEIFEKIDLLLDSVSNKSISDRLLFQAEELKKRSREMWQKIYKLIDKKAQ